MDPVAQVGDARYVFEAKTIQRMELLVLSTLKWRMQAVTPFSYIDYFLHRLNGGDAPSRRAVLRSAELILRVTRGQQAGYFRSCTVERQRSLRIELTLFPTWSRDALPGFPALGGRRGRRRRRRRRRARRRYRQGLHPPCT